METHFKKRIIPIVALILIFAGFMAHVIFANEQIAMLLFYSGFFIGVISVVVGPFLFSMERVPTGMGIRISVVGFAAVVLGMWAGDATNQLIRNAGSVLTWLGVAAFVIGGIVAGVRMFKS